MKKWHVLGVVVIAVSVMILITTAGDASSYVTFDEAQELAQNGSANKIHVVGQLKRDDNRSIIGINTSDDKLSFTFTMVDENQNEQTVYYKEPMPPDFLRSEKVVVIGAYDKNVFVADKILLKCPSKYVEDKLDIAS